MKFDRLCVLIAATFASPIAIGQPAETFPSEIQGIWMTDDGEGQVQCRNYRAAERSGDVDATEYLVGSEVIRSARWHSYAEYGEGNSYEVASVQAMSAERWRMKANTYIDNETGGQAIFRVHIEDGKLFWLFESFDGLAVDSWDEHRYFRCADVPDELYAS